MVSRVNPIVLGSSCILCFCGGSLKNGEIIGNNTTIQRASYGILDNVKLSGTYTNSECDLSWWGCIPYSSSEADNSTKIKNVLDSTIQRITVNAMYGISSPVDIGKYSHIIAGCSQMGEDHSGFVANSNFQRNDSVTINYVDYSVRGMFYYHNDEHPALENLCIKANYKADYAFEHVIGQPSIDFKNVYIEKARHVGILQYGCEHLRWADVMVRECGIGIFISSHRLVYTHDEDPITGERVENGYDIFSNGNPVSADNMLNLISCRVLECNYGFVIKGGTNTSLINCESAHNSILGLYTSWSTQIITNYYSENDGCCKFWIDVNGNRNAPVNGTVPYEDLIQKNKDGIATVDTNNLFNQTLYLRAPIYFDCSLVTIHGMFTSIHPRSNTSNNATTISNPTQRTIPGVDSLIIAKAGKVTVEGHTIYLLTNDTSDLAMPFKTYIAMSRFPNTEPAIFDVRSFNTTEHKVSVWYANNSTYSSGYKLAYQDNYTNMKPSWVAGRIHSNYNVMGGQVYGDSLPKYDFRQYATYKDSYEGIPLFQISFFPILTRKFPLSEVYTKFRGVNQVRLRLVMKVLQQQLQFKFVVEAKFYNSSDQAVAVSGYSSNDDVYATFAPGYYDTYVKMDLTNDANWDYLLLKVVADGGNVQKIYFSEFLFYDNEDGQFLPPPVYDSLTLP